ncbi:MAG: TonB-dependent receptor [Bacteroidota bacterium]
MQSYTHSHNYKAFFSLAFMLITFGLSAQNATISGRLLDQENGAVIFANVALYATVDSSLAKVETSDDNGYFNMSGISEGNYYLVASYLGAPDLVKTGLDVADGDDMNLGDLQFGAAAVELEMATVTAQRAMVEIKPDRTVFNVQGTINSAGNTAMELLRKAPGVTVDNNENINVLGRAGVLLYVDGKLLPLQGEDLRAYLNNLPAEQIDRFEIITNPGARYEAEGNAGIIDIRLKKDRSLGMNGSISASGRVGQRGQYGFNGSGNFRNKFMNVFGSAGYNENYGFNDMNFETFQNGLVLPETNEMLWDWGGYNARLGTDFFLGDKSILGFLVSTNAGINTNDGKNRVEIASAGGAGPDSILRATSLGERDNSQATYNINYRFDNGQGRTFNIDLDYGRFRNDAFNDQDNIYFTPNEQTQLSSELTNFDTPTDINIYTGKIDYEDKLFGGQFGFGTKVSSVETENTFLVIDEIGGEQVQNDRRSNNFDYTENVYAGYVNYARQLGPKWNMSAGLRMEVTDATGDLRAFLPEFMEPPVEFDYVSWFPSAGLTYQAGPQHVFSLNYGRRINRPDYNVLNPFRNQLSLLSFEQGNPFLLPEIVNNIELGYTLAYRYNFKLAYSRTTDQITRLIGPDPDDPRAGFISWANLANQTIYSLNISAPFQWSQKVSTFVNVNLSRLDNQADYGDGAVVDVQATTFNLYQQTTIQLPGGFTGEVSGWFAGPGVWGGVFRYESQYSLDLGIQKKFFEDRLNVRLSVTDITYQSNWSGFSEFNGQRANGEGFRDSRRVGVNMTYSFGSNEIRASRRRQTGMEAESGRVNTGG